MISLRDLPNTMFAVHPAGHEKAGLTIDRPRTCDCGQSFTQMLMATRELEAVERMGHMKKFLAQIPDLFVPVHCPKCERKQLTLQAQLDIARSVGTYARTLPDDDRRFG